MAFEPLFARVDVVHLVQVLMNLGINSRDAMDAQGTIRITTERQRIAGVACSSCGATVNEEFVAIVVRDNGPGLMSLAETARLFEPFFSTKEPGKGIGMGLSVVHGIAHELGGHIIVESTPGTGMSVCILPPSVAEAEVSAPPLLQAPDWSTPAAQTADGRILVVDDEQSVGQMLSEFLQLLGYRVTYIADPFRALDLVKKRPRATSGRLTRPVIYSAKMETETSF
ncbi:MAG: hypothetical protein HOI95_10155 [Chromatiales bacterium]|nr:hypothetical protein [Chromatiales bacterium]